MTRSQLDAAVALATGESVGTIRRRGFGLASRFGQSEPEPREPLRVIDCPCCGGTTVLAWDRSGELPEMAECRRCDSAFGYYKHEVYDVDLDDVVLPESRVYPMAA